MATKARAEAKTKQQGETERFFTEKAKEWDSKARGKMVMPRVNVIAQRNAYVVHVVEQRELTRFAFDVGSGVGDLVLELAERDIETTGIDFASTMIDLAHRRAAESKLAIANFVVGDFFEYHLEDAHYDLIAANGFLEYISYEQRDLFLQQAFEALAPGGSLVMSSRNRLFNLFSLNSFTEHEVLEGVIEPLVHEAVAWVGGKAFGELLAFEAPPLQAEDTVHGDTGVGVATRYQYTPAQVMQLVGEHGFDISGVSPIHVHGVVPAFKDAQPGVHVAVAEKLHEYAVENTVLLPQASAFMVHARKASE